MSENHETSWVVQLKKGEVVIDWKSIKWMFQEERLLLEVYAYDIRFPDEMIHALKGLKGEFKLWFDYGDGNQELMNDQDVFTLNEKIEAESDTDLSFDLFIDGIQFSGWVSYSSSDEGGNEFSFSICGREISSLKKFKMLVDFMLKFSELSTRPVRLTAESFDIDFVECYQDKIIYIRTESELQALYERRHR